MIQLDQTITPAKPTLDELLAYQQEVNLGLTFADKVDLAKALFGKYNTKSNATFQVVKKRLKQLCSGGGRCNYCETSTGDEVEHIAPKTLYPEQCFSWANYLYACGTCNGPKSNKHAVYRADTGALEHIRQPTKRKGQPDPVLTAPPAGTAALINPRTEDPMAFALLDLSGSFMFAPLGAAGTRERERYEYTFNTVLHLNERESLRVERKHHYGHYKARLAQYVASRDGGTPQATLDVMVAELQKMGHPTVWREVVRYHKRGQLAGFDLPFDQLFVMAPESLQW